MAEYVARSSDGFDNLVALAETVGAAVFDVHARLNFPNRHPLNLSCEKEVFRDADLILMLDVRDWEKSTHYIDRSKREVVPHYGPDCQMIDVGFGEINLSKWSMDYARMPTCSLRVLGDTLTAIPELTRLCRERIAKDPALAKRIAERTKAVTQKHDALFKGWSEAAKKDWDGVPITLPRLACEMWDAIKDEDWVLTACNLQEWVYKLWDFDKPYRHPGQALGTGTQIGVSLGVALAHRDKGRLVIDIQPDGDLMFDAGALWSAAKNNIPMLIVMYNNRAYYNDWEHQIRVAHHRGTPVERAYIAQDITGPDPDFATMAKSMGWYAEGPIENPADIAPALRRAIAQVKAGKPALVDTVLRPRDERVAQTRAFAGHGMFLLFLHALHRRFRRQPGAAAGEGFLAGLFPLAFDGAAAHRCPTPRPSRRANSRATAASASAPAGRAPPRSPARAPYIRASAARSADRTPSAWRRSAASIPRSARRISVRGLPSGRE